MNDANDNGERKVVNSLRDLPTSVQPPHDLWAGIEARIVAEGHIATADAGTRKRAGSNLSRLRWMAATAALVATLALGMWVGRSVLPTTRPITSPGTGATATLPKINDGAAALQAAYIVDPKYRRQREELAKSLEAKLASLPPDSRAKVISSLATIHKSMQDLEAELGKDPSNALLQELLVNTYQDEMRVLTTVHEASDAGEGI
jgi:N-acyl-D-aspartate/D-glutamate deacylase